jgi:hypothetical protein
VAGLPGAGCVRLLRRCTGAAGTLRAGRAGRDALNRTFDTNARRALASRAGSRGVSAKLDGSASVAQWKSSSVLRKWLGVRVPPGAPYKRDEMPGQCGPARSNSFFLVSPTICPQERRKLKEALKGPVRSQRGSYDRANGRRTAVLDRTPREATRLELLPGSAERQCSPDGHRTVTGSDWRPFRGRGTVGGSRGVGP